MKKIVAVILILFLCVSNVHADKIATAYSIQINAAAKILRLFSNEVLIKEYPVAVGKPTTKTPLGSFVIRNKAVNPVWNNKGNPIAPGPKNPLGTRWMGISASGGTYGIHGNNSPASISTSVSGGCIRMYNSDVEELYSIVGISTPVNIIYESIELKKDKYTDSIALIVYPDIYKKNNGAGILKKLSESNEALTKLQTEKAAKLAASSITAPVAVCQDTAIMLNEQFATNAAFIDKDQVYIYYQAAMELLGIDGDCVTSLSISVIEKDNKIYINLSELASKIGVQLKIDKTNNNAYLSMNLIKVNGKYLSTYSGSFDKEYLIDGKSLQQIALSLAAAEDKAVKLKELCKDQGWILKADSLNKIISIDIALKLKTEKGYINTVSFYGRPYIDAAAAESILGMQEVQLSQYFFAGKAYYDVYEVMELYEYNKDEFFTTIEVFKPLKADI